jgi:G patch domain-containing protein 1
MDLAFGIGHVEDEDDYDPYTAGPSNSTEYVFDTADNDDDVIVMGGPSRAGLGSTSRLPPPPTRSAPAPADLKGDRWHDGRPVLVGFTLDVRPITADKW